MIQVNSLKAAINRVLFVHGCSDTTVVAVMDVFDFMQPSAFVVLQAANVACHPFSNSAQCFAGAPAPDSREAMVGPYQVPRDTNDGCFAGVAETPLPTRVVDGGFSIGRFTPSVRTKRLRKSTWAIGARRTVCRRFARTGLCKFGEACTFSHERTTMNDLRSADSEVESSGTLVIAASSDEELQTQILAKVPDFPFLLGSVDAEVAEPSFGFGCPLPSVTSSLHTEIEEISILKESNEIEEVSRDEPASAQTPVAAEMPGQLEAVLSEGFIERVPVEITAPSVPLQLELEAGFVRTCSFFQQGCHHGNRCNCSHATDNLGNSRTCELERLKSNSVGFIQVSYRPAAGSD